MKNLIDTALIDTADIEMWYDTPLTMKNYANQDHPQVTQLNENEKCKICGQVGHSGNYPFSTLVGANLCDDCI